MEFDGKPQYQHGRGAALLGLLVLAQFKYRQSSLQNF